MDTRSADTIMEYLEEATREKRQIAPSEWLDAAQMLNVLMGFESDTLFELEQRNANARVLILESGKSASYAKMFVEASEDYKLARSQKAKLDRIIELIRLSKVRARLAIDEYHGSQ